MPAVSAEIIKKIRKIHILTTKLAKDLLAGAYLSAFKGRGMEFESSRIYQNGDEVRNIDWKVTARMNHPYVKIFREEREINITLVVDVSASGLFGSTERQKSDLIAEIAATIAFSAIKNNDKVGLILFSDKIEKYIPPKKGLRHVLSIILELLIFKPKSLGTDIANVLRFIGKVTRKSGVYFLISDFISQDFSHEAALIAKKCDLIAIGLTDPHEINLPKLQLTSLKGLESQEEETFDLSDEKMRESYSFVAQKRVENIKSLMNKINAGFIDIRTDKPYLPELIKFFKIRGKKRR
jgi:uncharacterized protein (DUF58 family)